MVTSDLPGGPGTLAERLLGHLRQRQSRCQEILARQEERLRLASQGLLESLDHLAQKAESSSHTSSLEGGEIGKKIASLLPLLESAISQWQAAQNGQAKLFREQLARLEKLTSELGAMRDELKGLCEIKAELARLAAVREQLQENTVDWKTRESQLLAEFENQKNQWRLEWNNREAAFNALLVRCSQLEEELEALRKEASGSAQSELQERYNLALAEIRELRQKNAELEKKAAQTATGQSPSAVLSDGRILNWEAEKQRILAALEAESQATENPAGSQERVRVEEILKRTETLLAEKDNEIAELRRLLEQQATNIGSMAVGAAALERLLDQDEVIRQHREHLRRLEEEWKEKLRTAELEISVERAKIARERALLEEKQRELEERLQALENTSPGGERNKPRGRWLTRLGLNGPPSS